MQSFGFWYKYRNKIIPLQIKRNIFIPTNYIAEDQNSISIIQPTQLPNTLYTGTVFATLIVIPAKRGRRSAPECRPVTFSKSYRPWRASTDIVRVHPYRYAVRPLPFRGRIWRPGVDPDRSSMFLLFAVGMDKRLRPDGRRRS